jgi:hypothetical protein
VTEAASKPSTAPPSNSLPSTGLRLRVPEPYRVVGRVPGRKLYEVEHERTGVRGVLQLVRGVTAPTELLARYAHLSQIRHPSAVAVFDAGMLDPGAGLGFVVREWLPGKSLDLLLAEEGALRPARAVRVIAQVLLVLAEVHRRGLVHGRLDPSHIVVSPELGGERVGVLGLWPSSGSTSERSAADDVSCAAATLEHSLHFVGGANRALVDDGHANVAQGGVPSALTNLLAQVLSDDAACPSAEAFLLSLGALDWSTLVAPEELEALQSVLGEYYTAQAALLDPPHHELMSPGPAAIWVLDDDGLLADANVAQALTTLGHSHTVLIPSVQERTVLCAELLAGSTLPPWVVVFGPSSVEHQEPLLILLASCAELTRVLLTTDRDFEVLRRAALLGLDQHVDVPCTPQGVIDGVERALQRAWRLRQHYDAIRLELRRGRDRVGQMARELATV